MPTHKYNAKINANEQATVRKVLWDIEEAKKLFLERGLNEETADLGNLLDGFVRELGMPRSLTEVGITGREKLENLARNTLNDLYARTNPIPLMKLE